MDGGLQATRQQTRQGRLVIGHEVRSFKPCDSRVDFWISGDSPALQEIISGYYRFTEDSQPYTPLFAEIKGYTKAPPIDGFGADYDSAIVVSELINILPQSDCNTEK
jgi:hypothetical protein